MRGADLAAAYAGEVVGPLLDREAPGLPIGLARLGSGSDVLGVDDSVSRDHDWGLRLTVLVPDGEVERIDALLEDRLPGGFRGHPVRFPVTWDPRVHQRAEVATTLGFARFRTGLDLANPLTTIDWLTLTGQSVLELTAGAVYRDDDGSLATLRERLRRYPPDVRLFAIASGWRRIGQELPFVRRTAGRGDDPGSRELAARLATTAMHIGFLLEGDWAPYSKWLGTAFRRLPGVGQLSAPLRRAIGAASGEARERALGEVIEALARYQGQRGLPTLEPATEPFWARGSLGLRGLPEFVQSAIRDPAIRALPLLGTPEQWSDSVDLLTAPELRIRATRALYGA